MTAKRHLQGQVVVITAIEKRRLRQVIGTDARIILWVQRLLPVLSIKFVDRFAFPVTSEK